MNPITNAMIQVCYLHMLTIYFTGKSARISNRVNEADIYRVSEDLWQVDDGEQESTVNEIALIEYLSRGLSWK